MLVDVLEHLWNLLRQIRDDWHPPIDRWRPISRTVSPKCPYNAFLTPSVKLPQATTDDSSVEHPISDDSVYREPVRRIVHRECTGLALPKCTIIRTAVGVVDTVFSHLLHCAVGALACLRSIYGHYLIIQAF